MDISLELMFKILIGGIILFCSLQVLLFALDILFDLKWKCRFFNDRKDDKK